MLCLTRKVGDWIHVGEDISILVKGINKGYRVTLAIEAPKDVKIVRGELRPKPVGERKQEGEG